MLSRSFEFVSLQINRNQQKSTVPTVSGFFFSTVDLLMGSSAISSAGIRLDACDVSSINYTPYKASRHPTSATSKIGPVLDP